MNENGRRKNCLQIKSDNILQHSLEYLPYFEYFINYAKIHIHGTSRMSKLSIQKKSKKHFNVFRTKRKHTSLMSEWFECGI